MKGNYVLFQSRSKKDDNPTVFKSTEGLRRDQVLFALIVAGFMSYSALFIYRTSFVVDGQRYFSLFDDAMISMRYARNLAHGYGLVWNPGGARVEGYTNPLWVLYMALIHLLPISESKTSLLVQITAAICLTANLFFVRKIALAVTDRSQPVALAAVLLTSAYLPINNWSLQGMEVSVLVLVMSVCLWLALKCLADGRFRPSFYILLGISTLVRPDMAVPFGGFLLFLVLFDPPNRRRHLIWGTSILLGFWAAQTLFRWWYFGDTLPNTYYLKLTGYPSALRIFHGAVVLAQFAWNANLLLFILPFMLLLRRDRRILLLLWALILQMVYSVYVGGDAWEYWGGSNRYICIAMSGFFVLLAYALFEASQLIVGTIMGQLRTGHVATKAQWRLGIFSLLIAFSLVSVNSIYGLDALAEAFLLTPPLHSGPGGENQGEVEQSLMLRKITTSNATLAVVRAGTIPYFSERPSVDLLGKNDRYIAHEPMRRSLFGWHRFIEFRPGHMKYDYGYSIGQQEPDVVVQLWDHAEEAQPYLRKYYNGIKLQGQCVYFRDNSANVLWGKITSQSSCGP